MPHYNNVYISQQEFEMTMHEGMRYDGFVEGLGYAYTSNFTIPPIHLQKYNPPGRVSDEQSFFQNGFVQYLDTSPQMRLMSVKYGHKVKSGDTLTSIAQHYGISIASIMAANGGIDWSNARNNGDLIFVGETLVLPNLGAQEALPKDASGTTCLLQFATSNDAKGMMEGGDKSIEGLLYWSSGAASIWDVYNNFGFKFHEYYPTTRGSMKPYSDFSGRHMSKQALKFKNFSRVVK